MSDPFRRIARNVMKSDGSPPPATRCSTPAPEEDTKPAEANDPSPSRPSANPSSHNVDLLELAAVAGADPLSKAMLPGWRHRILYTNELVKIGLPTKDNNPAYWPEKRQELMAGIFLTATTFSDEPALARAILPACGLGPDFKGDLRSLYRAAPFGSTHSHLFLDKIALLARRIATVRHLLPDEAQPVVTLGRLKLSLIDDGDVRLKAHLLNVCWQFFDIFYNSNLSRSAHDRLQAAAVLAEILAARGAPRELIADMFITSEDGDLLL